MSKEEVTNIIFHEEDFRDFRKWINLNLDLMTWEGRFIDSFEEFWQIFFIDGLSLKQVLERLDYAKSKVKIGPLYTWFGWLSDRFLDYSFIFKGVSIKELSHCSDTDVAKISFKLRDFFLGLFPHLEDILNERFHISHMANSNVETTYEKLCDELNVDVNIYRPLEIEVMNSLEITLYQEWDDFLKDIKKNLLHKKIDIQKIREGASFKKQQRFILEFLSLLLICGGVMFAVTYGNKLYEKYLLDKISLYQPNFLWLDKSLRFQTTEAQKAEVKLNYDEVKKIEELEKVKDEIEVSEERIGPESEVELASVDELPKDFEIAGLERSDYEELNKGGYRDNSRSGHRKVYRVLLKSVDPTNLKGELSSLLGKYDVMPIGNVKPGTLVPGGAYYNLAVPRVYLKEFLTSVMEMEESTLYENRSRARSIPGRNKVFIWVKQI